MGRWSGWIDVEDEDASFTVRQLVSYLRGAFLEKDYEKVEKLLMKREERIRAGVAEEVERLKRGGWRKEEMEKEVEKGRREAAVEIGKMRKVVAEESVKKAEKECEGLTDENSRDVVEMLEKLKREMEEAGKKRLRKLAMRVEEEERLRKKAVEELQISKCKHKKLEMKAEEEERLKNKAEELLQISERKLKELEMKVDEEERLRKKAEEELQISESKFKALEMRFSTMRKDFVSLKSLEARWRGTGNGSVKSLPAKAGRGAQNPVRVLNDEFGAGSGVPSLKTAAKNKDVSPVSPIGDANMKRSDTPCTGINDKSIDKDKQMIEDAILVISSDDEDDLSELQLRSKDKSDSSPTKLEFRSQPPVESDSDTSKLLSGLKRKRLSFIDDDETETVPHPSTDNGVSPNLLTQKGETARLSIKSLTTSSGDGDPMSVHSGQAEEKAGHRESIFDKVEKRLLAMGFDVSEDGSSSDSDTFIS